MMRNSASLARALPFTPVGTGAAGSTQHAHARALRFLVATDFGWWSLFCINVVFVVAAPVSERVAIGGASRFVPTYPFGG